MFHAGIIHSAIQEKTRLEIDAMGISKMRFPGTEQCSSGEHRVYHSGRENGQRVYGVRILLTPELQKCIMNLTIVSKRILTIQLNSTSVKLNIIQVYALTADSSKEKLKQYYESIIDTIEQFNKHDITVIMGDLNAKIGKRKELTELATMVWVHEMSVERD